MTMNKFLVNFILFGFIAIAVFGFLAMGHNAEMRGGCLAAAVNRSACPAGMYEMISFYLNAFKSFSLAVFSAVLNFAVLAVLFTVAIYLTASAADIYVNKDFSFSVLSRWFAAAVRFPEKYLRWLSLHENSPSFN